MSTGSARETKTSLVTDAETLGSPRRLAVKAKTALVSAGRVPRGTKSVFVVRKLTSSVRSNSLVAPAALSLMSALHRKSNPSVLVQPSASAPAFATMRRSCVRSKRPLATEIAAIAADVEHSEQVPTFTSALPA